MRADIVDEQRGKIKHRAIAARLNDFSGLRYGKITPTDLDGFIDFGNRLFVFFELKYGNAAISYGQKLAIERLVDGSTIPAIGIIADYYNEQGDVDAATAYVREVRFNRKWHCVKRPRTLRDLIDGAVWYFLDT